MIASDFSSRARAQPLRMRLLLLVASGLLPLVIVLGWGLDNLVEERRANEQESVLELSRALATAVDAELRSAIALLQQMSTSDDLERADLRSFQSSARRTAEQLDWRYVSLSDSDGRVLLRTREPYGTSDPTPREPHSMVRAVETRTVIVSHVVETPEFDSNSLVVRVPVMRGGQLVYVLSAVLPTDRIVSVLTRQNIPQGSVASVFDHTSRRVAGAPWLSPVFIHRRRWRFCSTAATARARAGRSPWKASTAIPATRACRIRVGWSRSGLRWPKPTTACMRCCARRIDRRLYLRHPRLGHHHLPRTI